MKNNCCKTNLVHVDWHLFSSCLGCHLHKGVIYVFNYVQIISTLPFDVFTNYLIPRTWHLKCHFNGNVFKYKEVNFNENWWHPNYRHLMIIHCIELCNWRILISLCWPHINFETFRNCQIWYICVPRKSNKNSFRTQYLTLISIAVCFVV